MCGENIASQVESQSYDVRSERYRQRRKWGVQTHSLEKWLSILVEEVGEVANAVNESDQFNLRVELIQVMAVVSAMLESLRCGEA